jgi:hypothetical protein
MILECNGNCNGDYSPCLRPAIRVSVKDEYGKDWGWYSYCEEAIKIDVAHGFIVTPINQVK